MAQKLYKVVRYCRRCKTRFILENQRTGSYYCEDCLKKYREEQEKGEED